MTKQEELPAIRQIAHDLNNTLIIISGNLELVGRHKDAGNPQIQEMIESGLSSVEKAKKLTQQMLAISRKS
jgi:signal transduction histidine kinase